MRSELVRFLKAFVVSIVLIGVANLLIYQEFATNFKLGVLIAAFYTVGLMFVSTDKKNKIKKMF